MNRILKENANRIVEENDPIAVEVIKTILKDENHSYFSDSEIEREYKNYLIELVEDQIESITSIDDCSTFIRASRRVTLEEWLTSLPE